MSSKLTQSDNPCQKNNRKVLVKAASDEVLKIFLDLKPKKNFQMLSRQLPRDVTLTFQALPKVWALLSYLTNFYSFIKPALLYILRVMAKASTDSDCSELTFPGLILSLLIKRQPELSTSSRQSLRIAPWHSYFKSTAFFTVRWAWILHQSSVHSNQFIQSCRSPRNTAHFLLTCQLSRCLGGFITWLKE